MTTSDRYRNLASKKKNNGKNAITNKYALNVQVTTKLINLIKIKQNAQTISLVIKHTKQTYQGARERSEGKYMSNVEKA